jgi:hypothetical protein
MHRVTAGSVSFRILPVPGSNFITPTLMVFVVISLVLVAGVIEFSDIVAAVAAIDR